jgi:hypothetical protein
MKYIIGVLILLFCVCLFTGLGAMTDGIKDFRTDYTTDNFILSTNATATNGTVHLTQPLWEGLTSEAIVSSNLTDDTPVIDSYVIASNNIELTGLSSNATRLVTIEYRTFSLSEYPGADTGVKYIPMAFIMATVFLPLLAIVMILLGR